MAFVAPLLGIIGFPTILTDWTWQARLAGSLALTTTSVAVVYAVLAEYELNNYLLQRQLFRLLS